MCGLQRQRLQNPQNLLRQFCTSCKIFCAVDLQPAAQNRKKRSAKILRSARKKSQVMEGINKLRRYPHGRSGFRRRSRAGNEGFPGIYAGFSACLRRAYGMKITLR
ncbi:MAG: hypothetical protein KHW93_08950 [Butyricicoccus pullicaecorum]|nr:hypothetical protein [Butyricicoccus pullicaecorum]